MSGNESTTSQQVADRVYDYSWRMYEAQSGRADTLTTQVRHIAGIIALALGALSSVAGATFSYALEWSYERGVWGLITIVVYSILALSSGICLFAALHSAIEYLKRRNQHVPSMSRIAHRPIQTSDTREGGESELETATRVVGVKRLDPFKEFLSQNKDLAVLTVVLADNVQDAVDKQKKILLERAKFSDKMFSRMKWGLFILVFFIVFSFSFQFPRAVPHDRPTTSQITSKEAMVPNTSNDNSGSDNNTNSGGNSADEGQGGTTVQSPSTEIRTGGNNAERK